jgi:uncharacterized protein
VLTKEDILKRLRANKTNLQEKFAVKEIALFGSYARGEQTPESDVDVLVEFSNPIGLEILDLVDDLEKILNGMKVDLINKKGIKPHYLPYI